MIDMRPRDLAVFMLASGEMLPRRRARDQQADIAGLELQRRVLAMLVTLDPEPEELESALLQIVAEIGPPHGPTRAICAIVRDDWEAAANTPEFREWLLGQVLRQGERDSRRLTTDNRPFAPAQSRRPTKDQ
jgi:hypothetical protein